MIAPIATASATAQSSSGTNGERESLGGASAGGGGASTTDTLATTADGTDDDAPPDSASVRSETSGAGSDRSALSDVAPYLSEPPPSHHADQSCGSLPRCCSVIWQRAQCAL